MTNAIPEPDDVDSPLISNCRLCGIRLSEFVYRCIGICEQCHEVSFQVRRTYLPSVQHMTHTGWRGLLTYGQLRCWREWQDEIIERVDNEAQRRKGTK
jgi:hypothetical protein